MDYKKAYDDLVAKLRNARNGEDQDERFCVVIDQIHPELKESEDERIRRILIDAFTQKNCSQIDELVDCRLTSGEIIEWLESGNRITSLDAFKMFGCLRLASRIFDLRERGMNIKKEKYTTPSGKIVTRYYL